MVQYLLPPGLRGIVVAGLLSALMGSLAGVFNACSTLFTVDLYEKWKPGATQHEVGAHGPHRHRRHGAHRPGLDSGDRKARTACTTICRPCRATWPRPSSSSSSSACSSSGSTRKGCLVGDDRGLRPGPLPHGGRHAGDAGCLGLRERLRAEGSFLWIVNNIYFQYFSVLITIVSALVMIVVSLATPRPTTRRSRASRSGPQRRTMTGTDACELGLARRRWPRS